MKTIRPVSVAVIGAGYMAREHCKALVVLPHCRVAGIMSRTQEKAATLCKDFSINLLASSIQELYEKTKADAVIITVPELATLGVYEECLKYPWHILVEKPAGYTFDVAKKIVELSRHHKAKTYVALNRRCYASTETVMRDVSGHSGKRYIHVFDQQDPFAALQSGQPKEVVDHWMYANSVHVIDYLRHFGRGTVERVEKILPWHEDVPFVVMATVHFSSGDVGVYEGIWRGPGPWAVQIVMEDRRWEMRPLEQAVYQNKGERKLIPFELGTIDAEYKAGIFRQSQYLCSMIRGEGHSLVTLGESFESMQLVQSIFGK